MPRTIEGSDPVDTAPRANGAPDAGFLIAD